MQVMHQQAASPKPYFYEQIKIAVSTAQINKSEVLCLPQLKSAQSRTLKMSCTHCLCTHDCNIKSPSEEKPVLTLTTRR